ncbi:hypothetical protein AAH979_15615 [Plantactinospora sp. ZYX-F-223]|uniref:hypothetical protein n=1 Tax=Plantactinospora sp. ZYX-F-223 TaxID=3144103 RepID=UPI0031FCAD55
MAYQLTLFAYVGDPVAHHVLPRLVSSVQRRDTAVVAVPTGDGVGWMSCDLSADHDLSADLDELVQDLLPGPPRRWPLALEVTTRPDSVREMVSWGIGEGGPASLSECDALIEVTLVGDLIDWKIVREICESAAEMWQVTLRDETSGFDVSIADLP